MSDTNNPRYVFREGDQALIIDRKGRKYLLKLRSSAIFHSHLGTFDHDMLISHNEGIRITSSKGHVLLAVKPTIAEYTRQMPRIATVVYPKDLGAIITYGDIFPGAKVLEAGTGSGAVTIALAHAVGTHGKITSYDIRPDMIERALENIRNIMPNNSHIIIKQGDVYQGFEECDLDRIVLDLPEPWQVIPHVSRSLVPGGMLVSFLPTVLQFHDLTKSLRENKNFDMIETMEILVRPWSVGGRSVRPAQRMVSHTGFITIAKKCSPLRT